MSTLSKGVQYQVTCMIGERVREAVMSQRELDECRGYCEVVEAIAIGA